MRLFRVCLQAKAERQLDAILRWWIRHRPEHPDLVGEEVAQAIAMLEVSLEAGPVVEARRKAIRRIVLPRSKYCLFYRVVHDEGLVVIEAVWKASRAKGPPLR
jgi:plasmid stabilization system protein ParE